MRRLRQALILAIVAAVAAGGLYAAFRPRAVRVETANVVVGRFETTVEEDGRTRVRNRYVVSTPVGGRVFRPAVRVGDTVVEGAVLATIVAAPSNLLSPRARREAEERVGAAEAMLEQAMALMERAAANVAQAETEARRVRDLHGRGATPLQALERAELALTLAAREQVAAERRRHAAEHELEQVRAALQSPAASHDVQERRHIHAPVAGRVLRIVQESEAVVAAGTALAELGDPGDIEVIVDVLTTEAVGIRPGAPVVFDRWGGPAPLEGRVRLVEPSAFTRISALGVEEQRVWVVIDLTSPPAQWAGLGDGFRVEARITVDTVADARLVPVSALFRRGDAFAVFVAADGVAHERRVTVARRGARTAMLSAGLAEGETVILFPPSSLREGSRILPIR